MIQQVIQGKRKFQTRQEKEMKCSESIRTNPKIIEYRVFSPSSGEERNHKLFRWNNGN